jgi:replicative DNA helicase
MSHTKTSELLLLEMNQLKNRLKNEIKSISSGYQMLDENLGGAGFEAGSITTIAARPGMGKTMFSLNIVYRQLSVIEDDQIIIFVSFKDELSILLKRLICIATGIPSYRYLTASLEIAEQELIFSHPFLQKLNQNNLCFLQADSMDVQQIVAQVEKINSNGKVAMVIIDDVHLMNKTSSNRMISWQNNMQLLRQLTLTHNLPLLLMSGIKRSAERRNRHHFPEISDLLESSLIGSLADFCHVLVRPGYYVSQDLPEDDTNVEAILVNRKSLYGITNGLIMLDCDLEKQIFMEANRFIALKGVD